MWRIPDLSRRIREPELMDDPALDPAAHSRAMAGLVRLNRAGRAVSILWSAIKPMATTPGHGPLSILDIATGSGDIPMGLLRCAHAAGAKLDIRACDKSEYALGLVKCRAEQAGDQVATFPLDAARDEIPGMYDVVMCSLFTHHLDDDDVVSLLYRMRAASRKLVLVSDLVRMGAAYRLAVLAAHVVGRNPIVRHDAAASMRAAFTIPEFAALAERAGLTGAEVAPRWPCRFLLTWRRER